ncbi:DEAD/DEAH box helicase [Desulfococcus sp.]|uniref:DEAD/DEAH box helicase n=1 Tax=Desulfococcus sp. TaxID=2025834 RepID=UPI0035948C94
MSNDTGDRPQKRRYHRKPSLIRISPGADPRLKREFSKIGVPEKKPFVPDPFQTEAVAAIEKGDCLVTAPTGSGKTWIAEQAIRKIRKAGGRTWYASPLKALSNSIFVVFCEIFGPENVGVLTGDRKENPDADIVVGTTEILRNQLYDAMHRGEDIRTDFVILDEAHFLGDEERGVVWEEVMIYLPVRIPLLLLSATIGNAAQIAGWLASIRSKTCTVIEEKKRPVPLVPLFFHPSGKLLPLIATYDGKKRLFEKVRDFITEKRQPSLARPGQLPPFGDILQVLRKYRLLPAIFFLKSRADCDNALDLCQQNMIPDGDRKAAISRLIFELSEQVPHILKHTQIRHLENHAVGAHHSGQLPAWKFLIEQLMTQGLLDAVFATSTVAAGVNFPARTIVFLNSDKFNGVEFLPLTSTEFHQMTGRAGRRGMDHIGFAMILPGRYMDARLIAKLMTAPPGDVYSQIKINFSMTLNLLLSHTPGQIELLLEKSFAAFLLENDKAYRLSLKTGKGADLDLANKERLKNEFLSHLDFLKESEYVSDEGALTEDGMWASQLRVDHPLSIAEGFRRGVFPENSPPMLAGLMAAFVNERESDDHLLKDTVPNPLKRAYQNVIKGLGPFLKRMAQAGFDTRQLYLRPCLAVYLWSGGLHTWEHVVRISELAEGDMAVLILRTADNLRHVVGLGKVFPKAAANASKAIESILRDPVVTFF